MGFDYNRLVHKVLIALLAFTASTAIAGGIGLLGGLVQPPLSDLDGSIFDSYVVPGLVLLGMVGGSALWATVSLVKKQPSSLLISAAAGLILMTWIAVEASIVQFHPLQVAYYLIGLAIVAGSILLIAKK